MRDFQEIWDSYRAAKGFKNDAAIARELGFSRANASKIRKHGHASDELCIEIAKTLDIEPALVLISRNAARDSGPVGDVWKNYLERVAAIAIVGIIACATVPTPANALENQGFTDLKDYRKFKLRQLCQAIARIISTIFPVTQFTQQSAVKP